MKKIKMFLCWLFDLNCNLPIQQDDVSKENGSFYLDTNIITPAEAFQYATMHTCKNDSEIAGLQQGLSAFQKCKTLIKGTVVRSVFIKEEQWGVMPKEFHNHKITENDTDKKLLYFDFDMPPVSYSAIAKIYI